MIESIAAATSGIGETSGVTPLKPMMIPGFGIAPTQEGPSFSDLIEQAAGETLQSLRAGEATTRDAVLGKVGPQEMVEAVMSMETSLRMTVAIRDKCVEAYQEIMRMPI